jgi:hypothetical protein
MTVKAVTGRRITIVAFAACAFAFAVVCAWKLIKPMVPGRPGVTRENFDRIAKGMTKAEVEQLFGGEDDPPEDDRYGRNDDHRTMRWRWDAHPDTVIVEFDLHDRAVGREWWYNISNEGTLEMLWRVIRGLPQP